MCRYIFVYGRDQPITNQGELAAFLGLSTLPIDTKDYPGGYEPKICLCPCGRHILAMVCAKLAAPMVSDGVNWYIGYDDAGMRRWFCETTRTEMLERWSDRIEVP